jgi:hypothetical protein
MTMASLETLKMETLKGDACQEEATRGVRLKEHQIGRQYVRHTASILDVRRQKRKLKGGCRVNMAAAGSMTG